MRWPGDSSSQLCEYVAQLCVVGAARCKSAAISFSESLDEGIAALAANLTILLAVSHNCHCGDVLAKLDELSLGHLIRDYEAGKLDQICLG